MTEVTTEIIQSVKEIFLPQAYSNYLAPFFYIILIAVYALFVWKFYRFIAKKDILNLNLNQYNSSEHPFFGKLVTIFLYILEYLLILPVILFFWFSVFSLFVLLLSKTQTLAQILLITAGIVGAIRVTTYISEDLSKDLAKLFPFTLLAIFLADPTMFSISTFFTKLAEVPTLFNKVFFYLAFIFIVEIVSRIIYLFVSAFKSSEPSDEESSDKSP